MREPGRIRRIAKTTFSSLSVRNYRLFFIGQIVSLSGTWVQIVAQSWLVLQLTHSGTALGVVSALEFAPVLFLGPYGGVIADRHDKRKILYVTQSAAGVLAILLGMLVLTGAVRLWMVFSISLALGVVNSFDNPTRQSFVYEMVGGEQLTNAVAINTVQFNVSRVVGPAIAGVLIAVVGLGPCFVLNGVSFLAVIASLALMRVRELMRAAPRLRERGQLREGLRYAWGNRCLRTALLMMALVGTLTYEFQITLPLLAKFTYSGSASTLALLTSLMGVGSVVGGLIVAARSHTARVTLARLAAVTFAFAASVALVAISPGLGLSVAALVLVGAFSTPFISLTNSILQLESADAMRGRVLALWSVAFLGSTLIGAPVIGNVAEQAGAQAALGVGAAAAVLAGLMGFWAWRRGERSEEAGSATGATA